LRKGPDAFYIRGLVISTKILFDRRKILILISPPRFMLATCARAWHNGDLNVSRSG
jgi:hypothetical protein